MDSAGAAEANFRAALKHTVAVVMLSPDPHTNMRALAASVDNDELLKATGRGILEWLVETAEGITEADLADAKRKVYEDVAPVLLPALTRIVQALRFRALTLTDWDGAANTKH